jgi:hypothetical protein
MAAGGRAAAEDGGQAWKQMGERTKRGLRSIWKSEEKRIRCGGEMSKMTYLMSSMAKD